MCFNGEISYKEMNKNPSYLSLSVIETDKNKKKCC